MNINNIIKLNEELASILNEGFCYGMDKWLKMDGFQRYDSFYNEDKKYFGINLSNGKKVKFQWIKGNTYQMLDENDKPIGYFGHSDSYITESSYVLLRDFLHTAAFWMEKGKGINEGIQGEEPELVVILRKLMAEENDAVASYNEKVKQVEELGHPDIAKALLNIASEELVHIGELEALLNSAGISADIQRAEGNQEVQNIFKNNKE